MPVHPGEGPERAGAAIPDAEVVAMLQGMGLFAEVAEADLAALAQGAVERTFAAGAVVVREGDVSDELYLVLSGTFQIYVAQASIGFDRELRRVTRGGYLGEMAPLTGRPRSASVRALTPGVLLAIGRDPVQALVHRSASFAIALCRGLAARAADLARLHSDIAFVRVDPRRLQRSETDLLPRRASIACRAVVVERSDARLRVAMVEPHDDAARSFVLAALRGFDVEIVAVSEADFERYARTLTPASSVELPTDPPVRAPVLVSPSGGVQELGGDETSGVLGAVLEAALQRGASDLHFEPAGDRSRVRLRVDGRMVPVLDAIPATDFARTVSRLKVLGELNITTRRVPQDGRFVIRTAGREIDVRVSSTPCEGGEKVVLRLLDGSSPHLELANLIPFRPVAMALRDAFLARAGLILATGPTGSGKTTTLYSGLRELWSRTRDVNIVTIEDPVEYRLDYATQTQVNPAAGLDFAQLLRATLRQDPDVILVGEIRDEESARIAVEAAMTGHLLLSSLHADSALESIARLRNLGVRGYSLASALSCVVSQRLLPRVCRNCAESVSESDPSRGRLIASGIVDERTPLVVGRGCELCRFSGVIGRVGLYEILFVDEPLRGLIEAEAPRAAMEAALSESGSVSRTGYARMLLEAGMVSPHPLLTALMGEREFGGARPR